MTEESTTPAETVPQPIVDSETSRKCRLIVEEYRAGNTTKVSAFLAIQTLLAEDATGKENEAVVVRQALGSYIAMLDNHDRLQSAATD